MLAVSKPLFSYTKTIDKLQGQLERGKENFVASVSTLFDALSLLWNGDLHGPVIGGWVFLLAGFKEAIIFLVMDIPILNHNISSFWLSLDISCSPQHPSQG
jgi:hypothetical protein